MYSIGATLISNKFTRLSVFEKWNGICLEIA